jgi:glycosyltransferase involved in cell wall biosynthesis
MTEKSTIIIPTVNNCSYLKLCIKSIKKNSFYNHQIIVHINGIDNETEDYLIGSNILYTKSDTNIGLCSGVNLASKKTNTDFIVYSHDDMYYLPKWDYYLFDEINKLKDNKFYFSSTNISHYPKNKDIINHIFFDSGKDLSGFDEEFLLSNYEELQFHDLQGSHWAPHVIHKKIWEKVGGFSEEFNPGFGSDPDLNMKLWKEGVRIFKAVNKSRVYHFGSLTTRKNKDIKKNDGRKTFLLKWKITMNYFIKYYLNRGKIYVNPLPNHKLSFSNFVPYLLSKLKYYIKIIYGK